MKRPRPSPESVRGLLRGHGLRVTQQREEIYAELASSRSHPSADELFAAVRRRQPGMSLATVYNTLEAFATAGLCLKIPSSGATRYDADITDHVHIHTEDGRVIDVPSELGRDLLASISPDAIARVERELGVSISGVKLGFTGSVSSGRS